MALTPRIELRQSQALVMTPQLQQSIKLLQMTNLDLGAYVAAEVERNPVLEFAPRPATGSVARPIGGGGGGGSADATLSVAEATSLWQHLRQQIGMTRLGQGDAEAALLVADELDDDGYLKVPLAEVAQRHRLSQAEVMRALAVVQSCEPAGVGARTLAECLALQLRERDRLDPAMQALLANLTLAARGASRHLEVLCGVDAEDIADMLRELRTLDPKPGARYAAASVAVALPDIYVTRAGDGGIVVELNTETLPRLLVNNVYASGFGARDARTRTFISECRAQAGWLLRSLEQRARTILRVATDVARHQEGFFAGGPARLRPLTQRAVATRLSLHEFTVSRVAAGKFLACDRGLFELRHFFSPELRSTAGGEGHAAAAVQERLRGLIAAEDPDRALSDDALVAILNAEGIDVARRTVAKYREGLGIPSSFRRRRR